MLSLARNGYTEAQVKAALHSSRRRLSFRYELLTAANERIRDLTTVIDGAVEYQAMRQIKRTARFTLTDDDSVDFLAHRIKPYVRIHIGDGYAEFPAGVFLLSTPPRRATAAGSVIRDVEAYDLGQVLVDDRADTRYTVPAGTNVITAVATCLTEAGLTSQNLMPTTATLPATRDWPPGTERARIIDDLLTSINYRPIHFDENGQAVAVHYVSPAVAAVRYTYADDDQSVLHAEAEQSLDLWKIPNRWVLMVSEADRSPLRAVYTNSNANSRTSTVSRGRTITAPIRQVDAVDQATLDAMAAREAFEASQVYEHVTFETAIMPFHGHADVLHLTYRSLNLNGRYSETGWTMPLKAGARMRHEARRVVTV